MKIYDIVFKEKCIVLGVFGTSTFYYLSALEQVRSYSKFCDMYSPEEGEEFDNIIIFKVMKACLWAEQIIFVLDDVQFPISPSNSYTCEELELVCKNPHLFEKCIFVKRETIIEFDKNLVT